MDEYEFKDETTCRSLQKLWCHDYICGTSYRCTDYNPNHHYLGRGVHLTPLI